MKLHPTYFRVRACCQNPDELGHTVLDLGATGVQIVSSKEIECYIPSHSARKHFLTESLEKLGFTGISIEETPSENWLNNTPEIWESLTVGDIEIVPVESSDLPAPPLSSQRRILIVPGTGFGTGHHESTKFVLRSLQAEEVQRLTPRSCLDVGTGSGILGAAAHSLYRCSVDALDNDPLALVNAAENFRLNAVTDLTLINGEVKAISKSYDLVLANIYAEVLIAIEKELQSRVKHGGVLILAGIRKELMPEIRKQYAKKHWLEIIAEPGDAWAGFLYKRI